jgi:hypothetical protein
MAIPGIEVRLEDSRLRRMIGSLEREIEQVLDIAGLHVERNAKQIIVAKNIIDTGATLNSTAMRRVPGDRFARRIGPTTEYAPHLEYGTIRMAPRPFMAPALEMERAAFLSAVQQTMERLASG